MITISVAMAEFFYSQYLTKKAETEAQQIVDAQKGISQDTVSQFTTLRNRLSAAKTVANNHIVPTQFLNLLETITVQNVHFTNVNFKVNDDRTASVTLDGLAANFNALETESTEFAKQAAIKNPDFSSFLLNKDNTVSFTVTATLDPSIVTEKTPVSQQAVPVFGPVSTKYALPVATTTLPVSTTTSSATTTKL
jgi:Tfp pilus assembly protein PilN